jgi:nonribosomal peptide synthetase protein BlmIV
MAEAIFPVDVIKTEWCRVLQVEAANPDDDFFALGGTSLLAVTMVESVERQVGMVFPLEALLVDGTLGSIIAALSADESPAEAP